MSPEENCPLLRIGVWVKFRVSFRVGGNQAIATKRNRPPVRVKVWVKVSFGVGDNFPWGQLS